jgi:hypothetical protein
MDEDLDAFLEDHGKPCRAGATDFLGILDQPDQDLDLGKASTTSTMYVLTVKSSVVAQVPLRNGTHITVDGVAYIARHPLQLDDGAFTQFNLTKV